MLTVHPDRVVAWLGRSHPGVEATETSRRIYEPEEVKELLELALLACDKLHDTHGTDLRNAVDATLQRFRGPRYEPVTIDELSAIKTAMVSGRYGIATHSGHWYKCVNGHPVRFCGGCPRPSIIFPQCLDTTFITSCDLGNILTTVL